MRKLILYMKSQAVPEVRMEMKTCGDTMLLDVSLMPLEMELLVIEAL